MAIEIDLSGRVALVTGGSRGLGRADALTLARAGRGRRRSPTSSSSRSSPRRPTAGARSQPWRGRREWSTRRRRSRRSARWAGARSPCAATSPIASRLRRRSRGRSRSSARSTSWSTTRARSTTSAQFSDQSPELWERDLRVNLTGGVQLRAGGVAAYEGARLGADREHGVGGRDARRLRPGELLDDEGRDPRADEDARDGGRPARDHLQCDRAGDHRHRGVPHGECGDERADRGRTVFKRPGEPQDIANAIAFLCSDLAGYITGVALYVSGGIELFVF